MYFSFQPLEAMSRCRDPQHQAKKLYESSDFNTHINLYSAKLNYLICQLLEAVSRYRDPQPQVVENDS